jgi:glutamyl-tRNA reductase
MNDFKENQIILIGTNHKKASVEIREKLALHGLDAFLLFSQSSCDEFVFLSTCNRVEIIATTKNPETAMFSIKNIWVSNSTISFNDLYSSTYVYEKDEAIAHLFRVAASLDSMVVGEPQILGQLKDAFDKSCNAKTVGPILYRLLNKTFSVAKLIRTETGIASSAVSISFAAVELARKIFGDLNAKKALLIGAGEMAELAAKHLINNGIEKLIVANRTLERAVELAKTLNGRAISLDEIDTALCEVDIVISSTGAPGFILTSEQIKKVMRPRKHRLLFLIDIAVPRDIEPAVNNIENVYLYDIDNLKDVVEDNISKREHEAKKAERIVQTEVIKFINWLSSLDMAPVIRSMQKKVENIRQKEFEKSLSKIKGLEKEQIEAIERLTKSITQKILNDPIITIKEESAAENRKNILEVTQRLFKLNGIKNDEF